MKGRGKPRPFAFGVMKMTKSKKPVQPAQTAEIVCTAARLVLDDGTVLVAGQTAEVSILAASNYEASGRAKRG